MRLTKNRGAIRAALRDVGAIPRRSTSHLEQFSSLSLGLSSPSPSSGTTGGLRLFHFIIVVKAALLVSQV